MTHLVYPNNGFQGCCFLPDSDIFYFVYEIARSWVSRTPEKLFYQNPHLSVWSSGNTLPFSERLYPRAKISFLLVSIRQFLPCSILWIVKGETPAFLASSALLMRSFSLIFLILFVSNLPSSSVYLIVLDIIIHILYFLSRFIYTLNIIYIIYVYPIVAH